MKKQKKQLGILILVLALLGGAYALLMRYNRGLEEKEQQEPALLVELEDGSIQKLSYDYEGERYSFYKDGEVWKSQEDPQKNLIQTRLQEMENHMERIEIQDQIDNVTDLSQYGLDEPSRTVQFETGEESYTVCVGDYNSVAGVYYVYQPSQPATVYTVVTSAVGGFDYTLEDLVEEEESSESTAS